MEIKRRHILKDYFSAEDLQGQVHAGFLQSMDFSGLSLDILNEVTVSMLDPFLFNKLSELKALGQWDAYMVWDPTTKKYLIKREFYADFVNALYVELMQADKANDTILGYNWKSISAQEQEQIVYGAKETQRDYDKVVVEITHGNDTEAITARTDTHEDAEHTDQHASGARIDTHANTARTDTQEIGNRTDTETPGQSTTTNKLYPLGGAGFIDDTQSITSQLQTSRTQGQQVIENETGPMTVTDNVGAQTVTDTIGKREITDVTGAQSTTKTYGNVANETDARTDTEQIKTHTDTKTRTKVIMISPEKYFEIQKELAAQNAYTLFADAVRRAFGAAYFGFDSECCHSIFGGGE